MGWSKTQVLQELFSHWGQQPKTSWIYDSYTQKKQSHSHTIHVWYIYLHLPYFTIKNNQM